MNSKEEQTNSEVTNLEDGSFIEQQKDVDYINEQTKDNKLDQKSIDIENEEPTRRRRRQSPEDINSIQAEGNNFGERRNLSRNEVKTGSRPRMNRTVSRQDDISSPDDSSPLRKKPTRSPIRQQSSTAQVEDASFKDTNQVKKTRESRRVSSSSRSSLKNQNGRYSVGTNKKKPRDNSSRFDD